MLRILLVITSLSASYLLFSQIAMAQEPLVEKNVKRFLKEIQLDGCVEIIGSKGTNVYAMPAKLPDGSPNNCLLDSILSDRASKKKHWVHDNVKIAKISKKSSFSFRYLSRPSLQATFHVKYKNRDVTMFSLDRFETGGQSPIGSFRHLFQEELPNHFFHHETDQNRMARSLDKKFGKVNEIVAIGKQ